MNFNGRIIALIFALDCPELDEGKRIEGNSTNQSNIFSNKYLKTSICFHYICPLKMIQKYLGYIYYEETN